MWETLGPVAQEVARKAARGRQKEGPALSAAALLERMGRSLELVSRLVREDAETGGRPIVTRQDREFAADLLTQLLTDPADRRAYNAFLDHVGARHAPWQPPDPLTRNAIHQQHWAQLSSGYLAGLLLNREGIEATAADLVATRPAPWQELLPKPRARSGSESAAKKKRPPGA